MKVEHTRLHGVLLLTPTPYADERGWFSRTSDAASLRAAGVGSRCFVQDSQSRSWKGVVRGLHGRSGRGEAKLVRCASGAIHDVVVDARPESPTFGRWESFRLDDVDLRSLYVPCGLLHGFQALTEVADTCYRVDAEHDPTQDICVRWDDPDLAVPWPLPVSTMSERDAAAPRWRDVRDALRADALVRPPSERMP